VRGILLLLQVFPFSFSYVSTIDDQHGFYGWVQISWVSSYIEFSFQTDVYCYASHLYSTLLLPNLLLGLYTI
jgi:hypothetical protein